MEQLTIRFTPQMSAQEPISIGAAANGDVIGATAHHLIRNGKPWYPVMGEFHYSRYPAEEWETELRKMKACGVGIVATYVFWIHHEEERGVWRTDGNLDLRRFLTLCGEVGLEVLLRIGPWAHGECRNGGFPDWLQHDAAIALRTDDPAYLALVAEFYGHIFHAARGLLLGDGGPIIGIQLENEYGHCGGESGGKGLVHMRSLKRLALEAGFRVPVYTATGWGGGNVVDGEMLPVMGGYADAPWDRCLTALPANPNYLMIPAPNDPMIAGDWQHSGERFTYQVDAYPYLTAELGGGIQCTFHRRPLISAADTAAQALVKLGTGANLLGYYMFHGGTHPMGKLSTMQESTATGSWTDVPVRSYDFQAPLGETGRLHESYYALKALHTFVADAGETLANSLCYFPEVRVTEAENLRDLRVCVRYDAASGEGFLFINNHQRNRVMADHHDVRFVIQAGEARYELPPMEIPSGFYGAVPFALRCADHRLRVTNLSLLCRLGDVPVLYSWGAETPVTCFDGAGTAIVLTREEALHAWKIGEALYIADGCLLETPEGLTVLSESPEAEVRRLPDGQVFRVKTEDVRVEADCCEVSRSEEYAVYRINLGDVPTSAVEDVLLQLDYTGDHAELFLDGEMIADDYAVGMPWRVALKRHAWPRTLEVRVYPVARPTYFEIPTPVGAALDAVCAVPVYCMHVSYE